MKKLSIVLLSASLLFTSCGSPSTLAPQTTTSQRDVKKQTATPTQVALARGVLSQGIQRQRVSQLSSDNVDWQAATVVAAGKTDILTAPIENASGQYLVIGLTPDDSGESILAKGSAALGADGNVVLTVENLNAGTKRVTTISTEGTLISERLTGQEARLGAQYTCGEFRDRVDDARDSANDAKVQAGLAAAGAAISPAGGPAAVAVATATLAYSAYRVITTDDAYRNVSKEYHSSCA